MAESRRTARFLLIILLCVAVAGGCAAGHGEVRAGHEEVRTAFDASGGPKPWNHLNFADRDQEFRFAIVSDRTGSAQPGVFEGAMDRLNMLHPEFVMCVGDLAQGYTNDANEARRQCDEVDGIISKLEMPFFYVGGNHDLSCQTMLDEWQKRHGRPYYHFIYRDVLFLVLDSECSFTEDRISDEQVQYVRETLAKADKVRWTMVFLHAPMWHGINPKDTGWPAIEAMLAERPHTVFSGHKHVYTLWERHGQKYFTLGTTGAFNWHGGPTHGQFDHIMWVTMTAKGPRFANLALDGIWPDDVYSQDHEYFTSTMAKAISAAPMLADGPAFGGARTSLRLRNPASQAVTFAIEIPTTENLTASPDKLTARLEPNEVKDLPVEVVARKGSCPLDAWPLIAAWHARTTTPKGKEIQIDGKLALGPAVPRNCPRCTRPVTVDGNLEEWFALPYVVDKPVWGDRADQVLQRWTGPADLSYRVGAAYDANYLYVAVDVTDDKVIALPGKSVWSQDAVMVYLDVSPQADGSLGKVLELKASPAVEGSGAPFGASNSDKWPKGTRAAVARTPSGYAAEFAVPIDVLDSGQNGSWDRFRLNIGVEDEDGAKKHLRVEWMPQWELTEKARPRFRDVSEAVTDPA